jgi:multiple sugar transport system substrate-binding protein
MRRLILLLLAASLGAAGLSACGGVGGKDTVNIILENHPWTRAITEYLGDFQKETGIKANVQLYSEEQSRNKILVTLQSHSPGLDVFMSLPSLEGRQYEQAGYYQALDSYAGKAPKSYRFDDFSAVPLAGERVGGKLIGIPINVEGPVIFYRTDLFKKYGIALPRTISDVVAAAKAVEQKSHGEVYGLAGRGLDTALAYTFGPFLRSEGLSWVDSSGKPNFDKPGAVRAISNYATLVGKYGPPGAVSNSFTQSSALFAQGKVAMELESSNEISSIDDPDSSHAAGHIGVMTIPRGSSAPVPTVLQWGLSMSRFGAHHDNAWKFIQWATSPQMQLKLALKGIASPRKSTATMPAYTSHLTSAGQRQWSAALQSVVAHGSPQVGPPAVEQAPVRKLLGDEIDKVILGDSTAAQAAAAIQKGLTPLVSTGDGS